MKLNRLATSLAVAAVVLSASFAAQASHRWGNYHWGTTSYPINLQVIDSNTPDWDGELAQTLSDWSASTKLNLAITSSDDSSRARMCQEIGHLFGLGHTSEDGSSQGTCMDYSSSPNSTRPNSHDYNLLLEIYNHTDSSNTWSASSASTPLTAEQHSMAGQIPMGVRVHKGVFHEIWAAGDGRGGTWIHHVTLAAGHENEDVAH